MGFLSPLMSQTSVSGVINKYGRVSALGTDYVIIEDRSQFEQFAKDDTVLLIQMKGVRITTIDDNSYGSLQSAYGNPGEHEFLIIQAVESGTKKIVFRNNIINSFSVDGALQIVRIPSYNSAVVNNADLTCMKWDSIGKIGGVLSMIVGRSLSLNRNIDVTGMGFSGGAISEGTGLCTGSDLTNLDKYAFSSGFTNSGIKGESPVIRGWLALSDFPPILPGYAKGKGANLTGGGGGNGRFSGGGGGSNYGAGGKGGLENSDCFPLYVRADGGRGGIQLKLTPLDPGFFLGGGGGSSSYLLGSAPSPGGNGGGIIIIISESIEGNGKSIISNGTSASQASSSAGSGGGGGGGSVTIYLQSFLPSVLSISANGGKGGNNSGTFGEGGGGGGGLINVSNIPILSNVSRTVSGGAAGSRTGGSTGGAGSVGEIRTLFVPVLNGFLFNSIRSSVTGNQIDSICSNVIPKEITGTMPVGGSGSYTYLWQKSYNLSGPVSNIPSSNTINYLPEATENDTVWFRRIVKDNGTSLTDTSKWVNILVQPAITGNLVGKDTVICFNQNPLSLVSQNSGPAKGNGVYEYKWIENSTNTGWTSSPDAAGTVITEPDYDPPVLTSTTYYTRVVTSGRCIDYSPSVKITVLPSISGNLTSRPDSVICEGALFNTLGASAAGGGDLAYKYQWQDSTATGLWSASVNTNDALSYSPDTSVFSVIEKRYFRRVVFSGPDNVCRNNSSPIQLIRYHKIKTNSILADQTICSGSAPLPLSGSVPSQGSGIYTYMWQDSSKVSTWTTKATADFSFSPSALTDTTWFRRVVNSSKCTNTSFPVRLNVHKPIMNNNISLLAVASADTTICNGAVPNRFKGTIANGGTGISDSYAYQWLYSNDNTSWNPVLSGATGINYQPAALTTTTYYKRRVISGSCTEISSSVIAVTVLPVITNNNIPAGETICSNTAPALLTGATLSGGAGPGSYLFLWEQSTDGSVWTSADGANNSSSGNYQPPSLTVPMKYKRIVKSGANDCCSSISNTSEILIHSLPSSTINAGPDTTFFTFDYIIHMVASPLFTWETGKWTLVSGTGDFDDYRDNRTSVRNISKGKNSYLWTTTNGPCKSEDIVNVDVYEIAIPEGFSPNNDPGNYNNKFIVAGLDLQNQTAELKIVNGAGSEIFSTTNLDGEEWTDWDGTNSKGLDLPEGTYYYLLKITSKGNGQVFKKSGFVVLKRY